MNKSLDDRSETEIWNEALRAENEKLSNRRSQREVALETENKRLREALEKLKMTSERLIFGSHGTAFLPGQMKDWKNAVAAADALKVTGVE